MSRQFWSEALAWATANGTAVANSAAHTILFPNITIPANYLQDGRVLRINTWGAYGTTATPTIIFDIVWGGIAGTVVAKTGTITTGSAVGGGASMTALWNLDAIVQTRSNGSAGTLFTDGVLTLYTTGTAGGTVYPLASGSTGGTTPVASAAVDLTADTALSLGVTWGTANAANSIQGNIYILEGLN